MEAGDLKWVNKHLLDELRDEIARSDSRAKEISTSLTGVRRETEEQANKEMALLRNELDLAVKETKGDGKKI